MAFRDDESTRAPRFIVRCQISEHEGYAVDARRPEASNPSRSIRVHHTIDGGTNWTTVPMRRSLASYLRMWRHGVEDEWPPVEVEELRWEGRVLRLRFRDDAWAQGVPYDHIWDAYYHPQRRVWTIERVRRLEVDE